ncbi:hypothetical protein WJX79_006111 [Trebouxia sp. C0005]
MAQLFTPRSSARPDSELVKGWKQLEADATSAETVLVSGNFALAASDAESLLRRTLYVPDSVSVQIRAAFVLLQALYELDRLPEAKDLLVQHYTTIEAVDPTVVCLWVSLAIDTHEKNEAGQVLKAYLHSAVNADTFSRRHAARTPCRGQPDKVPLTSDQYAAAAQLYAVEVLGKSCDRLTEAERWVMQDAHMLQDTQQQDLLQMLADLKPKSSPIKPSKRPIIDRAATTSYSASATPGQEEAQRLLQQPMQSRRHSSSTEIQPAEDQPDNVVGRDIPTAQADDAANQWNQGHAEAGQASWFQSGHDWVAATSSQLASLASKANALWTDEAVEVGGLEMTSTQLVAATAVATLLSIAAVAERKALKRLAGRSMNWLQQSIVDAGMAAFSLTPNPMTTRGTSQHR